MAEMDDAVRVIWAIKASLDQIYYKLHQMQTPQAAFEEKQSAVNLSIDKALGCHHSARSNADAARIRDDILRHGAELHRLRQEHEATLDARTEDYERQRRLAIEQLCRLIVQDVGIDVFQKALRDLTNNQSEAGSSTAAPAAPDAPAAPANQPTPPATEAESEVVSPVEHPVRSPPASPERSAHADASASSAVRMRIAAKRGIYC